MNLLPPAVAISSCLLGEAVRYDGLAKPAPWVVEALGPWVRWVPVCPEVAAGLGTPRPPIDLFGTPAGLRVQTSDGAVDHTDRLVRTCRALLARLDEQGVCGYVLKARSPSCGIGDARVRGAAASLGDGLMVRLVRQALPGLPLVSDEALRDAQEARRFLRALQVFARARARGRG